MAEILSETLVLGGLFFPCAWGQVRGSGGELQPTCRQAGVWFCPWQLLVQTALNHGRDALQESGSGHWSSCTLRGTSARNATLLLKRRCSWMQLSS